jgi:hypothetical protein
LLTPSEAFIIYLFLGLFAFLGVVFLFSFGIVLKRRRKRDPDIPGYRDVDISRPKIRAARTGGKIGGDFREKLGEKVVKYMIDISKSGEKKVIVDRVAKIIQECNRMNSLRLPAENKRIISTVLLWARGFDIDRHTSEIKIFQHSSQIIYDPGKRDFQLRIFGK